MLSLHSLPRGISPGTLILFPQDPSLFELTFCLAAC